MSNAAKNGLLTIVLPAPAVARMIEAALAEPGLQIAVDLEAQSVTMPGPGTALHIGSKSMRTARNAC